MSAEECALLNRHMLAAQFTTYATIVAKAREVAGDRPVVWTPATEGLAIEVFDEATKYRWLPDPANGRVVLGHQGLAGAWAWCRANNMPKAFDVYVEQNLVPALQCGAVLTFDASSNPLIEFVAE